MPLQNGGSRSSSAAPRTEKQESLDLQLLEVVKNGTAREVDELISQGANVQRVNEKGQNLLFDAAGRKLAPLGGRTSMLKALVLSHGLDATAVDTRMGQTPLFFAAREGDLEACEFLLEQKCKPDDLDNSFSQSALFYAARQGHEAVAELLLERRALVDRGDVREETPLFYAASGGQASMTAMLSERRADLQKTNSSRQSCLFQARGDAVSFALKAHCDPNYRDRDLRTPIFMAASNGDLQKVRLLVSSNAEVNLRDVFGWTCLFFAASKGHVAVVESLCSELRADVRHKNTEGHTAKVIAEIHKHRQAAQVLDKAEKKRNVEARRKSQTMAQSSPQAVVTAARSLEEQLYLAVQSGGAEEVARLLSIGAPPTKVHGGQNLAFLAAARPQSEEPRQMCELLAKSNVDLDQVDSQLHQTPLFFSVRADPRSAGPDCASFLLESRCDCDRKDFIAQTPLFYAARRKDPSCVELLLNARAQVDSKDMLGKTALFHAAEAGSEQSLHLLLERRADAAHIDMDGTNALFYAKTPAVAERLVENHCSISHQDSSGRTCLFSAVESCSQELVKVLITLRGDVNTLNRTGESCLFSAVKIVDSKAAEAMCRFLVKVAGASASLRNERGESPVQEAASAAVRKLLRAHSQSMLAKASPSESDVTEVRSDVSASRKRATDDGSNVQAEPRRKFRIAFKDDNGKEVMPGMPGYESALRSLCEQLPWLNSWDS